ncbi:kinase-like domain-containing protein [Glomus cerebriforme]|uniref:Kinase-like domain-containing protein n=1 Tax=Glomus cerebriforme TaxID=658196 RepID=A0A397T651_9GLOM|nr:kinase-like domain-containing protein [Glomus cerebriforme]
MIKIYGITKDPKSEDYMLVMQYASEGDLHNYLQKEFTNIVWNDGKLNILRQISEGLANMHDVEFVHRDLHSGNILFDNSFYSSNRTTYRTIRRHQWKIGDLGLSQPANDTSSNNEIYGVIPYIAPEIFKGSSFSKESDVYSMGMIMWELTTGCKPFADVDHDHNLIFKILDGVRPKITEDTPECYADLMKSCWDPDPQKRPSITEIRETFYEWCFRNKNIEQFNQAEIKRNELMDSKKLGPKFTEKTFSKAIYTSRPLSFFISKCSTISLSTLIPFGKKQDYISTELEFDIDIERTLNVLPTSLRKRNFEELNIGTHDNCGKHIRTS